MNELQAKLTKESRLRQLYEDLKNWNDSGKDPKPRCLVDFLSVVLG